MTTPPRAPRPTPRCKSRALVAARSASARAALLIFAFACSACRAAATGTATSPQSRAEYALAGVRVLDVERGTYSPRSVVLVSAGRIQRLIPEQDFRPGLADSTIDLAGKFLLPGLIDGHVHLTLGGPMRANAIADLRAGFTTVVDLGSLTTRMLVVRDSINAGHIPGPRVLATGVWVGAKGGVCEFNGIGLPADTGAFRERIRNNVAAGANVIKLCITGWPADAFAHPEQRELSDDLLSASVDQAHKLGRRVVAHDLSRGGVTAALRVGVDGLAHAAYVDSMLATQLRDAGIFMIPTLASLTAGDTSEVSRALVRALGIAHRVGVRIVFGTDAGAAPHGRNAEEFLALQRAGLTPLEAIRAATINAALAFGLADSVGTVRPGMSADVIAVDADPLTALEALRSPSFVMLRGKPMVRP